jgi:hypothetical protein
MQADADELASNALKVPVAQGVAAPPRVPLPFPPLPSQKAPRGQGTGSDEEGQRYPAGQGPQSDAEAAPGTARNKPGGQACGASAPCSQ